MSARTDGVKFEPWQCALGAFFRSHCQFHNVSTPTDRATRTWWNQRHKYLTEEELSTCLDPGSTGDGGFRESAGNVGIGSEYIDSAGGGWGDSHTGDAEQSEAGGPAFADALAADANIADAVPHHEAQAQLQAQFPSGESPSFVAARAADAAIAASAARSRRAGCGTHKWHARRTSLCLQWQAGGGSRRAIGTKRCSVRFDRDAPGAAHTSGAQGAHPAAGRGRRMGGRDVR